MVDILLAASKSENVESRQDAIDTAGLKAKVVDVEAFAIANAFELIRKRDGVSRSEAVGFFDIGYDLTTLLVIKGGRVIYTRDHPFGGHQLLEETQRRYDMTAEQASFFERNEEAPDDFEEEVLEPFQLNIVHQISRALQFYASSSEYSNIGTIYLSGGVASLKGLAPMVQHELGMTTRVADPVTGMDIADNVAVTAVKRNATNLMIAIGLALRGFDLMARINLLPWREEQRRERQRQFMSTLLMISILGVVLVFLAGAVFDQKIKHQQYRNELVNKEIRKLEGRIKRIDELERTRARLISRKQVIERLQASRAMTVELLDKLAKSIPVGVTLTSMRQQGTVLVLAGTSQSNARVSAYLKELDKNDLFLNPQLDFVRSAANPVTATEPYQFSIKVKLRPPKASEEEEGYDELEDQGGSK